MHSFDNTHLTQATRLSHPILNSSAAESPAERLKNLLLSLSRDPENKAYKAILRSAADNVRHTAFGYNRATTKRKIVKLLEEFHCLELVDITDETGITETEIKAALSDLITEGKVVPGKRRRWQEPGKHYNEIYELAQKLATIG
jgi:hypothetical protein